MTKSVSVWPIAAIYYNINNRCIKHTKLNLLQLTPTKYFHFAAQRFLKSHHKHNFFTRIPTHPRATDVRSHATLFPGPLFFWEFVPRIFDRRRRTLEKSKGTVNKSWTYYILIILQIVKLIFITTYFGMQFKGLGTI